MKISKSNEDLTSENTIKVVMYLHPIVYETSEAILGSVSYDSKEHRYHTDINPFRVINGPLSEYGEELQSPIKEEYEEFLNDCLWLIKEVGFTVIKKTRSNDSKKSEYVVVYGIDDTPCGTLIYDLRISDHPFDATFPEELKNEVIEYLNINKILDGSAAKVGIDFQVEKITVGTVKDDTWDRAFYRLYKKLKEIRRKVNVRLHR